MREECELSVVVVIPVTKPFSSVYSLSKPFKTPFKTVPKDAPRENQPSVEPEVNEDDVVEVVDRRSGGYDFPEVETPTGAFVCCDTDLGSHDIRGSCNSSSGRLAGYRDQG